MANPTTNFGWVMPNSADLVTDLPADFAVFGQAVDTSLVDLKGGTTGQILSKATNTDMDFTWVALDDANAIQNALLTTTGDIIYASAASTPARLAAGTSGYILTSGGAGVAPSWAAASSGGMTLLSTTALSGTTTTVSSISGSYKELVIYLYGYDKACDIRLNGSSSLFYGVIHYTLGGTAYQASINAGALRGSYGDPLNGSTGMVRICIPNYANTSYWKPVSLFGGFVGNSYAQIPLDQQGIQKTTSAITSVDIVSDGGSFAAGSIKIYGVS